MSKRMDRRMKGGPGRHVVRDALAAALAGLKYWLLAVVLTSLMFYAAIFGSQDAMEAWNAADAQGRLKIVMPIACIGMLAVTLLLYGRMRVKKRLTPGAFSVKGMAAYGPVLAAVGIGGLLGAAAAIVQEGSLQPLVQMMKPWRLAIVVIGALFSVLLYEGRMIACLKERGYAHEEIIRMLAGIMLFVIVANLLLTLANGGSLDVVNSGIKGLYALLTVVLCGRVALRSGRLTEAFVLRLMLHLMNGLGTMTVVQAVQIAGLAAAILLLERIPAKTA
ncbi:MAG: hypothetical protein ACI4O4_04725 [Candidatus Ventricola sp.]